MHRVVISRSSAGANVSALLPVNIFMNRQEVKSIDPKRGGNHSIWHWKTPASFLPD
jgi:hypothetical protein